MKENVVFSFRFSEGLKNALCGVEEVKGVEPYNVSNDMETAKKLVAEIDKKCVTSEFVGVEIDNIFDNLERYDNEFTIIQAVFENVLDELCCITEAIRYWQRGDDYWTLNKTQAKSHAKKLIRFVERNLQVLDKHQQLDYIAQLKKYNV